jgi:hypothetical protein
MDPLGGFILAGIICMSIVVVFIIGKVCSVLGGIRITYTPI